MKALILVKGELNKIEVIQQRINAESFNLIIGVDGGTQYANALNLTPDIIIGDMDSLTDSDRQKFNKAEFILYPTDKDETDLELALQYAVKMEAEKIVMIGAMGGRMDMTIANIMLISQIDPASQLIEIWHGEQTGFSINPPGKDVYGQPGDTISIIPLNGVASGVTTRGLEYALNNENLLQGSVRGISNVFMESSAHISLDDGLLLAVHTPGVS